MAEALSEKTIRTVRATAPLLNEHGVAITTRMYERLFVDEQVRAMFSKAAFDDGEQARRLASAMLAYACNVDQFKNLEAVVGRMAARHVEAGVRPEHYPLVAQALIPAIADVLGDAASEDVLAAWAEAYGFLADVLVEHEARLYARRD